jgi:hypothetical protein
MSFLLPAMLGALAALAIPVLVHLRFREKDTPFKFPSLMFLERIPIRTAQRRRLTDWPLFLLRAAALALLVLAFARPYLPQRDEASAGAGARSVVLLLDRSMSMSHRAVWSTAMDSVSAILDGLAGTDQVALVVFDEEPEVVVPWTADHAAVRAAVAAVRPLARGTRYGSALRTARQLLAEAGASRPEALLITDLQRSGVVGISGLELPAGMTIRSVPVGTDARANVAVSSVEIRRTPGPPRATLAAQGRLIARELPSPRRVRATLTLNGRPAATRDVELPADGEIVVAFDAVPAPAGRVTGTITIDPDAITGDDTLHFALPRDDAIRVLLLTPGDGASAETLFFERALGIGEAPTIRVLPVAAASATPAQLSDAALVVLWDVLAPTRLSDALSSWTESGGGVVSVVSNRLGEKMGASPLVPATAGGVTERSAAQPGSLGEVTLDHPLFAPFRDASAALSAVRVTRYARLDASADGTVLARFDDGLPAVIEARRGRGRSLVVAVPLDARGGDFPLQPAFLPFLRRLVLHSAGHTSAPLWRATGESWALRAMLQDPVVASPDGGLERPSTDSAGSAVVLRTSGLYSAYQGRVTGEPLDVVAVNPPPSESDLTPVDPRELLLGIVETSTEGAGFATPPTSAELEARQGTWRWLLALVALLVIGETLLSTRGWRATARRSAVIPSDRSVV